MIHDRLNGALCDVADFHAKFGVPRLPQPIIPDDERVSLRMELIQEESTELLDALCIDDIVGIADGIADLIYVALGTALEYGIPIDEVWHEVHRTNMLKTGGATSESGKIMKPADWKSPDIFTILARAGVK